MKTPKISIIVPIYNAQDFIERCIISIIEQTYTNIEVILVDDGSSDGSLAACRLLQERDSRIYILSQENRGVSSARNLGIDSSTGEYVTFVDSDDWLERDAIETMVTLALENQVDCVRMHHVVDRTDGSMIRPEYGLTEGLIWKDMIPSVVNDLLLAKGECHVMLLLVKRVTLVSHGLRFSTDLSMMEDVVFYCNLLSKLSSIYLSNRPTYHYFWNQGSASKSTDRLIENARSTIEVSGVIDDVISGQYSTSLDHFNVGAIHATHLSLIASRILTSREKGKRISFNEAREYASVVNEMSGFRHLYKNSDLNILSWHQMITVYCLVKENHLLYYWALRLRQTAIFLRARVGGH